MGRLIRLIFLLMCVLITVDTGCFVYSSLSRSLLGEVSVFVLGIFALSKSRYSISTTSFYIMCWIFYSLIYSIFQKPEAYRFIYFVSSLCLMIILSELIRHKQIKLVDIENGFILIGGLHLITCIAQSFDLVKSTSAYFEITGLNENPNITAIFFVGCVPIVLHRLTNSTHKAPYLIFLFTLLFYIIILKCRTAYIGCFVIGIIFLIRAIRHNKKIIIPVVLAIILIIPSLFIYFYEMKKDSTDGRLLIWKISAQMIQTNPEGYGYGLFEKNYNLFQARYFELSPERNIIEKQNAAFVSMPYNDYIEHTIEGGIIGGFFYLTFFFLLMLQAFKQRKWHALAIIVSYATMALSNFIYTSIQSWFLLMCVGAYISKDAPPVTLNKQIKQLSYFLFFSGMITIGFINLGHTISQSILCIYKKEFELQKNVNLEKVNALQNCIGTSEAYWQFKGRCFVRKKEYEKAYNCFKRAICYTSNPNIFFHLYFCLEKMGKPQSAIFYIKKVSYIIPLNLKSRILIMRHYHNMGQNDLARNTANEIVELPVKVTSSETLQIKKEAINYLKTNY